MSENSLTSSSVASGSVFYTHVLGVSVGDDRRGLFLCVTYFGVECLSWYICIILAASMCVVSPGQRMDDLVSTDRQSRVELSGRQQCQRPLCVCMCVCVCVCHHAMSPQCHGTGIDGVAACVIKMYEGMLVPLSASLFAYFFLSKVSLPPCLSVFCLH